MKVKVTKASDFRYKEIIEIDTLKDLLSFVNNEMHDIIVNQNYMLSEEDKKEGIEMSVMIYDDYVE